MAKIKFVTDSAADIPAQLAQAHGIEVLPFPIILEDRQIRDGIDYNRQDFLHLLNGLERIPSHAQLTAYQLEECFLRAYREGYDALIYTSINSKGSSTYSNALQARDAVQKRCPGFDIRVIDSRSYSFDYGYPVLQAAKLAGEMALGVDQAVHLIQDWLQRSVILFAPYQLRFARASGRIPVIAAVAGTALGIRPIMSFPDGEARVLAKPRGDKHAVATMLRLAAEGMEPGSPYLIIRGIDPAHNREMEQACVNAFQSPPAMSYDVGGVIAINAGPDLIGIIYRSRRERNGGSK
ncbi:MAG: DegV family protein [Oscillospiraceae bacterium]|nr:DegV family protein [Oscillospiraceae bacterium]